MGRVHLPRLSGHDHFLGAHVRQPQRMINVAVNVPKRGMRYRRNVHITPIAGCPTTAQKETGKSLARFLQRHRHATLRAGRNRVSGGTGPVLAYVPSESSLGLAMHLARGSSLCVAESDGTPMRGWAATTDAIDLTRPNQPPIEHDPRVARAVGRLVFYASNGYGPQFDRQRATTILRDLDTQGSLDRGAVLGAVAASGVGANGVKRLAALIDRLGRQ
jgi:hypothetical protein